MPASPISPLCSPLLPFVSLVRPSACRSARTTSSPMGPNSAGLGQRAPSVRAVASPSSERIPASRALDESELSESTLFGEDGDVSR